MPEDFLVAHNPDPDSALPYLIRLPLRPRPVVLKVREPWPRTSKVYCHRAEEWPERPEVVERVLVRSCERRGAAIDLVLDRARENRSQLVFTRVRGGREAIFWQSPRTAKQARPNVRLPTRRAAGVERLQVLVDVHERYPYRFAAQQVDVVRRALPAGDYAVELDGRTVAAVERKSLPDLVSSLTTGKLRYALAELAGLPRAAVVVEDRYAEVFRLEHVAPGVVADGLAELQVRWPCVPLVFPGDRKLAEEWTYRFLGAAYAHLLDEDGGAEAVAGLVEAPALPVPPARGASLAEVRAWAREQGWAVSDRGRVAGEVLAAYDARAEDVPTPDAPG